MPQSTFDAFIAFDPTNPSIVAANAAVTLYAPGDSSKTPLPITDLTDVELPNPLATNDLGAFPAFRAPVDRVAWSGGGMSGVLSSYDKVLSTATEAAVRAADSERNTEEAAQRAEQAAGLVRAPADTVMKTVIDSPTSETADALERFVAERTDGRFARTDDPRNTFSGLGALAAAVTAGMNVRNNNAYGKGAMQNLAKGRYNDAFGLEALFSLDGTGYTEATQHATRNSAFGSNSQRFNKTGWNNISMGRNSMQCNVTGTDNVALGSGSMAGLAPIGLGGIIENQLPMNVKQCTAVGVSTLDYVLGDNNTAYGFQAGRNVKASIGTVAIGAGALAQLDVGTGPNGKYKRDVAWSADFTFTDSLITLTYPGHTLAVGNIVRVVFPFYEAQHLEVTQVDGDSFNLGNRGNSFPDASGKAQITYYMTNTVAKLNNYNTALGFNSLGNLEGSETLPGTSASNTALGLNSMRYMQDGTPAKHVAGSAAIGANSRVSGNDQVQLGAENVTVYAAQPIQVRSDARDKTDVRDTVLGLDFISRLRPVDYRWDRRSEYYELDEDGTISAVHEPDGSRKGERFHHGFIAQEVQQVIEETGVDFGGFQDHKLKGGNDVLSIGYEEIIAPLVRAVQELASQVNQQATQGRSADGGTTI